MLGSLNYNLNLNDSFMEIGKLYINPSNYQYTSVPKWVEALNYRLNPSDDYIQYIQQKTWFLEIRNKYIAQVIGVNNNDYKGWAIDYSLDSNVIKVLKEDIHSYKMSFKFPALMYNSAQDTHNFIPTSVSRDIYHPKFFNPCFVYSPKHHDIVSRLLRDSIIDNNYQVKRWFTDHDNWFENILHTCSAKQLQSYIGGMRELISTWPSEVE